LCPDSCKFMHSHVFVHVTVWQPDQRYISAGKVEKKSMNRIFSIS
jgi:hypothetical protein